MVCIGKMAANYLQNSISCKVQKCKYECLKFDFLNSKAVVQLLYYVLCLLCSILIEASTTTWIYCLLQNALLKLLNFFSVLLLFEAVPRLNRLHRLIVCRLLRSLVLEYPVHMHFPLICCLVSDQISVKNQRTDNRI